jgi:hypothetical protein
VEGPRERATALQESRVAIGARELVYRDRPVVAIAEQLVGARRDQIVTDVPGPEDQREVRLIADCLEDLGATLLTEIGELPHIHVPQMIASLDG